MRNIFKPLTFVAACLLLFTGCDNKGYELAPISGTVTYNGEPVPKLSVVFSPEPIGTNNAVGPFSTGKTDSAGKFSLTTRRGDEGAVVGKHTVAFEYTDIGETAMADLRDELADLQEDEEGSKEDLEDVKRQVKELTAKLKGRPVLERSYRAVVDIPSGGTDDLKIELTEMVDK